MVPSADSCKKCNEPRRNDTGNTSQTTPHTAERENGQKKNINADWLQKPWAACATKKNTTVEVRRQDDGTMQMQRRGCSANPPQ